MEKNVNSEALSDRATEAASQAIQAALTEATANGTTVSPENLTAIGDAAGQQVLIQAIQETAQVRAEIAAIEAVAVEKARAISAQTVQATQAVGVTYVGAGDQIPLPSVVEPVATQQFSQQQNTPAVSRRVHHNDYDDDEFGLDTVIGAAVVVAGAAVVAYAGYKLYEYITE